MNGSKKYGGVEMDKTIGLIALAIAAIVAVVAIFGFLQVTGAAILTSKETTLNGGGSLGTLNGGGSLGGGGSLSTLNGGGSLGGGGSLSLEEFEALPLVERTTYLAARGLTVEQFEAMPEEMKKALINLVNIPDEAMVLPLMKLAEKGMPLAVFESLPKNIQETILTMKFGVAKEIFDAMDESTKEVVIADEGLVLTK